MREVLRSLSTLGICGVSGRRASGAVWAAWTLPVLQMKNAGPSRPTPYLPLHVIHRYLLRTGAGVGGGAWKTGGLPSGGQGEGLQQPQRAGRQAKARPPPVPDA